MNLAPIAVLTILVENKNTCTQTWTNSMTPILRPTKRLSQRSEEGVLTLKLQTVLFQEKSTFSFTYKFKLRKDCTVNECKKCDNNRKKNAKGKFCKRNF